MKAKILLLPIVSALLATLSFSCSESDTSKAKELYTQAQQLNDKGECEAALNVLNQLDSLYPREFDIRKQGKHLRPKIIEKQTLLQISANDSLLAIEKWHGDSLALFLRLVNNPVENYYVAKSEPKDINSKPGVYARMSPDANFYLTVVTPAQKANAIDINGVKSATLPFDDYRVTATDGKNCVLTFMQAEIDTCMKAIQANPENVRILLLNNDKEAGELKLSANDINNILNVYANALSVQRIKLLTIKREHLEQTLSTARSQIARTAIDSIQ